MGISEVLKQLRIENKFTQQEVANRLDISTSAYGFYEQGKNIPPFDKIVQLSKLYGVSLDEFAEVESQEDPKDYRRIKVYGQVPAGIPLEAIEDIQDFEDISFKEFDRHKDYIGLKVKGDSMYPKYLDGDTVIIEVTPQAESGDDAIVYINGYNATLKKIVFNSNGFIGHFPSLV